MTNPYRGIRYAGSVLRNFEGRVALWEFESGSGYGVYLYETPAWHVEDDWLLYKFKQNRDDADEIFSGVLRLIRD
jgi:hypothetical protein